jgi:hypothetical protein
MSQITTRIWYLLLLLVVCAGGFLLVQNTDLFEKATPYDSPNRVNPASASESGMVTPDHPLRVGRLNGEALDQRMAQFVRSWKEAETQDSEQREVFREFVEDIGVQRIVDHFETFNPYCHADLHELGSVLVELTQDLMTSMWICGDACTYSCVHGIVRQYFTHRLMGETHPNDDGPGEREDRPALKIQKLKDEAADLCKEDSRVVQDFFRGNCAHAFGHVLTILVEDTPHSIAEHCRTLFGYNEMYYYCETGVFMQRQNAIKRELYDRRLAREEKLKRALDFCLKNTLLLAPCLRFTVNLHNVPDRPMEIEWLTEECLKLQGKTRRGCFYALGYASTSYVASHPEDIHRVCRHGDLSNQKLCITGLSFLKKGHPLKDRLLAACQYLRDNALKETCIDQHQRFYYQLDNPVVNSLFI